MSYEIRRIHGQDIFVKRIRDDFWLINDVFVNVDCKGVDMTSADRILSLLDFKDDPLFPYEGADKDVVISLSKSALDNSISASNNISLFCFDNDIIRDARRAFDEYKSWARI